MKFAFVFPGQGSQSIGMLNAFADHAVVRETVQQASDALGQDLARLTAEGPAEELNLTTNTQPVMLTAAYAIYRVWEQETGLKPAIVAGHSLGEYTALVAAGALAFSDAVPLVRFRAQAMQSAVPVGEGGMAAILGLDDDAVRAVCEEASAAGVVEAVNFNAPSQVVIAGAKAGVEKACEIAKAKGAKRALPLTVAGAYHSALMASAQPKLQAALKTVALQPPVVPVISNVTARPHEEGVDIQQRLVDQVTSSVRWEDSMRYLLAQGFTRFIELGPGKALSGFMKRIDPNAAMLNVSDVESLEATAAALAGG